MIFWILLLMAQAVNSEQEYLHRLQTLFDPAEIESLLQSSDAREAVWGSYLAGQSQQKQFVPVLKQIVEREISRSDSNSNIQLDAALDSLIQLKAKVSPDFISAVYKKRPAPALILSSMVGAERDSLLLDLASRERGVKWFAMANMLLADNAPGAAALLMKDLEIVATIVVSDDGAISGAGGGMGSAMGGDGGVGLASGYPLLAYYYLGTGPSSGSAVLATGPTTVYYGRNVSPPGETPVVTTWDRDGPETWDRLRYIAALGNFEKEMPLYAAESRGIKWQGQEALDAAINKIKRDILHRHSELIRKLKGAQLLTEEEASAIPEPKIAVRIHDLRSGTKQ